MPARCWRRSSRPIGRDDTSEDVERDAGERLARRFWSQTLDRLAAGPIAETPQDDAAATYAHRLTKEDGLVDWSRSATSIHNQIRGLTPGRMPSRTSTASA